MSIKVISMDHLSSPKHTEAAAPQKYHTFHDVFNSFLSINSRQNAAKTTQHRKCIIELLNQPIIMSTKLITT